MTKHQLYSTATLPATATAFAGARQIDQTQNGVKWITFWDGSSNPVGSPAGSVTPLRFFYRKSDDDPWVENAAMALPWVGTGANAGNPTLAMFVDLDDYMHFVYKDRGSQQMYYRRGTPNVARTSYTWSAAINLSTNTGVMSPDVVAHRDVEATGGWYVHVVFAVYNNHSFYRRAFIAADGTIGAFTAAQLLTAVPNVNYGGKPTIDFYHTGDGKTVKGGTPHLYVIYNIVTTALAGDLYYRRYAYTNPSAVPTWTQGVQRTIYGSGGWLPSAAELDWHQCRFNGNASVYIMGVSYNGANRVFRLYERTENDVSGVSKVNVIARDGFLAGSSHLRPDGDGIFVYGTLNVADGQRLRRHEWVASTNALEAGEGTVIDNTVVANYVKVPMGRRAAGLATPILYTDGAASPYTVTIEGQPLPKDPGAWVWSGSAWVARPWNVANAGGVLVTQPVHYWNGSAWVAGPRPA